MSEDDLKKKYGDKYLTPEQRKRYSNTKKSFSINEVEEFSEDTPPSILSISEINQLPDIDVSFLDGSTVLGSLDTYSEVSLIDQNVLPTINNTSS